MRGTVAWKLPGTVALVDRGWLETGPMTAHRTASVFAGFRFPPAVISLAVRWYLRYGLSHRDVEELLAERGIAVNHVTIYRWVQRFTAEFIEAARPCRHAPGDRWFADETYVKIAGAWTYLNRATDQHGQVDSHAADRFGVRKAGLTLAPSRSRSKARANPSSGRWQEAWSASGSGSPDCRLRRFETPCGGRR